MKISIITITYNTGKSVRGTLTSVSLQSYNNIEHIIVDGVSKDDTLSIVKEYPHVTRVLSEKDNGIYDAMNKGVKLATGDIVGILNSDDMYADDDVIQQVIDVFESDKSICAVYGDLNYVDEQDTDKVTRVWKSGKYSKRKLVNGWMPPHPSFFVKKEVYEKYGLFSTELVSAADYEFMLRLLYKYEVKAAYLPKTLVKMRAGGVSNSSLKNRLRANKEDYLAWKMNGLKPRFYTRWLKPLRKLKQFKIFG